jgi:hypothetical protein
MNEVPSEGVITVLLLTISLGIALATVCNLYWALREEAPMTVEPVFPVRTGVARRTFAVRMANPHDVGIGFSLRLRRPVRHIGLRDWPV